MSQVSAPQVSALFEPGQIGSLSLPNRFLLAPMEKNYCNRDGTVTNRYRDYLVARADGEVALMRCEAAYVDPVGKGRMYQLGVHGDHVLPGLTQLAEAVHDAGGRISAELCHAGRQVNSGFSGRRPASVSELSCEVSGGYAPRDLTRAEIREIIRRFGDAAARCQRANFDAVEIHGASGYLINSFLSPFTNTRSDEWGGSDEKRGRMPIEVVRAVREAVGPEFPLLFRLCADEFLDGGLTIKETAPFAELLAAEGVDFIDVTGGVYETSEHSIPPMEAEPAEYVPHARAIKERVVIPIGTTGRLGTDLTLAGRLVETGVVDFVSLARAIHADPDFVRKLREGRTDEVRPCVSCSECATFIAIDQPAYCAINPATARERQFLRLRPAKLRQRVLVVGAGPAGLEAAHTARLRGHDVIVLERDDTVGGQVRFSAVPRGRQPMAWPIDRLERELNRLEVPIRFGIEATTADVEQIEPDVVIVATGARPANIEISASDDLRSHTAIDVLAGHANAEDSRHGSAVIIGANWIACHAADYLADQGLRLAVVDIKDTLAPDVGMRTGFTIRRRLTSNPNVALHLHSTVERATAEHVEIWNSETGETHLVPSDFVVIAAGMQPDLRFIEGLDASGINVPTHLIGDCVQPRKYQDAAFEAVSVASAI